MQNVDIIKTINGMKLLEISIEEIPKINPPNEIAAMATISII